MKGMTMTNAEIRAHERLTVSLFFGILAILPAVATTIVPLILHV